MSSPAGLYLIKQRKTENDLSHLNEFLMSVFVGLRCFTIQSASDDGAFVIIRHLHRNLVNLSSPFYHLFKCSFSVANLQLLVQLWTWCIGGTLGRPVCFSQGWWSVWPVCSSSVSSLCLPTSVWVQCVSPSPSVSTINYWSCCAGTLGSTHSSESVSVDLQ